MPFEYERSIPNREKRLIHVSLSRKNDFLIIRIENYCEDALVFAQGLPVTTKGNTDFHGFGMKSILYSAEKYGGTMTAEVKKNWFELRLLVPLPQGT